MSHPCDGHSCDHCYLCDEVGICCMTVPQSQRQVQARAVHAVRAAVVVDAAPEPSIAQLIREGPVQSRLSVLIRQEGGAADQQTPPAATSEVTLAPTRPLLPPGPSPDLFNHPARPSKEVLDVIAVASRRS
jgi:hypothetical protein